MNLGDIGNRSINSISRQWNVLDFCTRFDLVRFLMERRYVKAFVVACNNSLCKR